MVRPPIDIGLFKFVVLASLRAKQLTRGCTPRVVSDHKIMTTAQIEVAEGKVTAVVELDALPAPLPGA